MEDLEEANRELASLERSWERYSGNNPNKYRAQIKSARLKVTIISDSLKASGVQAVSEGDQHDK